MIYKKILITGGAGFVGSNIAIKLKEHYPNVTVIVLDNLKRRGSELNLTRLKQSGIKFVHGDVRNKEDLASLDFDLMIECSAEPSVLAGVNESPEYVINTNLVGAINCLEAVRQQKAHIIFLSSSRVYPMQEINSLQFAEEKTRFNLAKTQTISGSSERGISEDFPLGKTRSIYGATKLAAELLIQEYIQSYHIKGVINRCGVITGPWQMGKIDQGVIALWLARHIWKNKPLSYIGFGGSGKQVRDFIHIDDLFSALQFQLNDLDKFSSEVYNIGGGVGNSLSLLEMTQLCQNISGNKIKINSKKTDRPNDLRIYISDSTKFQKLTRWSCKKNAEQTFTDIYNWIVDNKKMLEPILY